MDFLFRIKPQVKSFYGHDTALLHATVWTLLARSSGSLNHSYLLHLNQNHENSISHDRSKWGENGSVTTATHSSILPVPVKCNSSGDTPLHTFISSYMLFFWRHTAAYFQFQLNANLLECTSRSLVETLRRTVQYLPQPAFHNLYQTTRCYSPERNILRRHCHDIVKPHLRGQLVFDKIFWGK
jgi:hypothetical protein